MKIEILPYNLELIHQFNISYSSRKITPALLIRLEQDGLFGYGEASLPPYLKENQNSVRNFLEGITLPDINEYSDVIDLMSGIKNFENSAAMCALDIALHDLLGKLKNIGLKELINGMDLRTSLKGYSSAGEQGIAKQQLGAGRATEAEGENKLRIDSEPAHHTSFTIGIDSDEALKQKISEAAQFKILKIKLGTSNDKQIIDTVRKYTDKPLYVDANQGWKSAGEAIDMIRYLQDKNVLLIEQPLPVDLNNETRKLLAETEIPLIADESFRTYNDFKKVAGNFSGINIKLMKCGGIVEALKIIATARELNLKIMIGCMTETSCAISAGINLSPLADYADLDGNLLISNDPFSFPKPVNGRLVRSELPGLGIELINNIFG